MAVLGRKPKPEDQRRNQNRPTHEWIDVQDVPYEGPVPSPGVLPAATKRWWAVVSRMPHCVLWDEDDWQFALDTARIHAAFAKGRLDKAAELRLRGRHMGMGWDARRDLRIRYVPVGEPVETERPISIEDRRRELAE